MTTKEQRDAVYMEILKRELVPAMGCTEPIAIAYCAAKAREVLGAEPDKVLVEASGNVIKNVKSVIVPNTEGCKGVEAAAAIGILAGDASKELEVISSVTEGQKAQLRRYLQEGDITVRPLDSEFLLDMIVTVYAGSSSASVRITNEHTNIVRIQKDGQSLLDEMDKLSDMSAAEDMPDYDALTIEGIYEFATTVGLDMVKELLDQQIAYNTAISEEGLKKDYGANIGAVLLEAYGDDIKTRAKAKAAAGSDARMNGCEMPVIINSGSGNQGMTVSLPVIEYARELGCSEEKLYRALLISNLSAIHQKYAIGRLSAYCGAVSAGAGAGAAIAYLHGGGFREIAHTIVNALAITSGIVCDGAKASCAAKIATSVDAGILGYEMFLRGKQFYGGDGVITKGVENTIRNIGRLGRDGMRETDKEIIKIMTCVD